MVALVRAKDVSKEELDKFLEDCEDQDLITQMLKELEDFPALLSALTHERDLYMTEKLRKVKARKIVAVVGRGHIKGILKEWENPHIDLDELSQVALPKKSHSNLWAAGFGVVVVGLIGTLLQRKYAIHFPRFWK